MDQTIPAPAPPVTKLPFHKRKKIQYFTLGVILTLLILGNIFFFINKLKQAKHSNTEQNLAQLSPTPMLFASEYKKYNFENSIGPESYPTEIQNRLTTIPTETLTDIQCSSRLANEGGEYFMRDVNSHSPNFSIDDPKLLTHLRTLEKQATETQKLLTARLCQTKQGELLVSYTIGSQPYKHPDFGADVTAYLAYINKTNQTVIVPVTQQTSWSYPGCDNPFVFTSNQQAYVSCSVSDTSGAKTEYFMVDFATKQASSILSCTYTYTGGVQKVCK